MKDFEKKHNHEALKRIPKALDEIRLDPYSTSKRLEGSLHTKRSMREGSFRIIFIICEECRKLSHQKENGCTFCEQMSDKTVIFVETGLRGGIYG
jgi:hypothetical protein